MWHVEGYNWAEAIRSTCYVKHCNNKVLHSIWGKLISIDALDKEQVLVLLQLTAQHYLWKDILGFIVHPDIPTREADLKVADIATGNG